MSRLLSTALVAALAFAVPAHAQITYNIVSYHGVSHASHQASFNNLQPQGYRLISLAVAGGYANAHYSAVWQQVAGPAWVSSHGMTEAQYSTQRIAWLLAGYRPKIVTASGSGSDVVFAAVFVNDGVSTASPINQSLSTFESDAASKRSAGYRLVSCAVYGTAGAPLHAPVYELASDPAWGWEANDTAAQFTDHTNAHADADHRPSFLAMSDAQRYLSVWRDDRVGGWAWVGNRTAAQFTADKTTMANAGLHPLCIAAGGSGSSARFSGVFVERLTPYSRTLSSIGTPISDFAACDQMMQDLLVNRDVRAGALAVIRNGRLVYARGYTRAEPGYPATTPTTMFRIGSISKPLTGMLAHGVIDQGLGGLSLNTAMASYLGITNTGTGIGSITLQQLLTHSSGFINAVDELAAAQWWNAQNPSMPPDESVITRYACLFNAVGAGSWKYSNAGITAVGQVVEQATGLDYMAALGTRMMAPLGVTRFGRMQGPKNQLLSGEVRYHLETPYLRAGNLFVDQRRLAPQYCQRFWDAAGGVVTSAVDLARILAGSFQIGADSPLFTVARQNAILTRRTFQSYSDPSETKRWTDGGWGWRERTPGSGVYTYYHDGAQDGFQALCMFRSDGIGAVALFNGDHRVSLDQLEDAVDAVTNWPSTDRFPDYGLPAFPRTPSFGGFATSSLPNVTKNGFTFSGQNLDQVTHVTFGPFTLLPAMSTQWENGYVVKVSPTSLRVHAPQGILPGSYAVRAFSAQGGGNTVNVNVTHTPDFVCEVQDYVIHGSMPFSVIASRGPLSDLSWVLLAFSMSPVPSVAPGIVTLDLGAGFTNYFATDLQAFHPNTRTARWDFGGLNGYGDTYFQCAAIDFLAPQQFPLLTTPRVMLDRL